MSFFRCLPCVHVHTGLSVCAGTWSHVWRSLAWSLPSMVIGLGSEPQWSAPLHHLVIVFQALITITIFCFIQFFLLLFKWRFWDLNSCPHLYKASSLTELSPELSLLVVWEFYIHVYQRHWPVLSFLVVPPTYAHRLSPMSFFKLSFSLWLWSADLLTPWLN